MRKICAWLLVMALFMALLAPGMAYAAGESKGIHEAEMPEEDPSAEEETEAENPGRQEADPENALKDALEKSAFADDDVIAEGVYIDKIDVSGMTADEALEEVLSYVEETGKKTLTLTLEEAGDVEPVQTTVEDLGMHTDDIAGIVMEALALGKGGSLIVRYKSEKDLKTSNQIYEIGLEIDADKVNQFVTENTSELSVEPVDAELTRTGDGFSVSESKTGIKVDVPATVSAAQEAFQNWNRQDVVLAASAEITQPEKTTAMLSQIQDPLGEFSASTKDTTRDKLQNVQRGVDLTNGILIMPGESWSMHDALAPFTAENGYTMQIAYQGNTYVKEYGGGICQLATTLYNAALLAEVNISKRSNHSMTVGYTIKGLDATINDGGSKDLELTNDFDFPIYIEAYHNGNGTVTYTVWGKESRPANRTVKFTNNILSEEYLPDEVTLDPGMAPGTQTVTQATSYPKATVEAYKEIYIDGILQEKIRLHTDKYLASARKIVKGPDAPADPNAGLPAGTDPGTDQPAQDPGADQPETPPAVDVPPATEPPATEPPATEAASTEAPVPTSEG